MEQYDRIPAGDLADLQGTRDHTVALAAVGDVVRAGSDPEAAVEAVRGHVRGYYGARDPDRPMFLLLVGEAVDGAPVDGATIPPRAYAYDLDAAPETTWVATDHRYADMDGDDLPDLAVGRLPATTPAEVSAYFQRSIPKGAIGVWDRRINLFAGSYGQGAIVDNLIEGLVDRILDEIPRMSDVLWGWNLERLKRSQR